MTITPCGRSLEMAERATHHPPPVHATPRGAERSYSTELYNQRNVNETMNASIKQKFGALVRSRLWWEQLRKLVINYVDHNGDRRSPTVDGQYRTTTPLTGSVR